MKKAATSLKKVISMKEGVVKVVAANRVAPGAARTYIDLEGFNSEVKALLLSLDLDDSGKLSLEELRDAVALFRDIRSNDAGINYTQLPQEVQVRIAIFF